MESQHGSLVDIRIEDKYAKSQQASEQLKAKVEAEAKAAEEEKKRLEEERRKKAEHVAWLQQQRKKAMEERRKKSLCNRGFKQYCD